MPRSPTVYIQCHRDKSHLKAFNKYVPRTPLSSPPGRGSTAPLTYGKASAWVRQHCHIVRTCLYLVRRFPNLIRDDSLHCLWEFLLPFLRLCALTVDGRRASRSDSDISSVCSASTCSLSGYTTFSDLRSTTPGSPIRGRSTLHEPESRRTMKPRKEREGSGRYLVPPTPEYPRSRSPRGSSGVTSKERPTEETGGRREAIRVSTRPSPPPALLPIQAFSPSPLRLRPKSSAAPRRGPFHRQIDKISHGKDEEMKLPVVGLIKLPPIRPAQQANERDIKQIDLPTGMILDKGKETTKEDDARKKEVTDEEEETESGVDVEESNVIMKIGENTAVTASQRKTTYLVYKGPNRSPEIVRWPPNREERRESLLTLLESDSDFSIPLDVVIDLEFDSRSSSPDSFLQE